MKRITASLTLILLLATIAVGQEEATELARRLLGPWGDQGGATTQVLPAQLPAGAPEYLTVPEQFRLIGSLANYNPDGSLSHSQVVLDSPWLPPETLDRLAAELAPHGWRLQPQEQLTGFQPAIPQVYATFCGPENMYFLHFSAFPLTGNSEITDVRLELNANDYYWPCGDTAGESYSGASEPAFAPLPALYAPMGSELTLHGGNYLEDQGSSSAVIATDLPADELLRHFELQLERAGWERVAAESAVPSSWRITYRERDWLGTLDVTRLAQDYYYLAFVVLAGDR